MKTIYKNLLTLSFILAVFPLFAQGGPPATPIDGGLTALLAAGGIYGIKKIRDHRKQGN
ncbi:MAG: hypothetical protein NXI20_03075 [bacterium]|nr:hypothetical protein [bacterium]